MKLIDEKLVDTVAREYVAHQMSSKVGIFTAGVDFAEQQLKQKMIEFGKYCLINYPENTTVDYKTTEQLLEEFINKQK